MRGVTRAFSSTEYTAVPFHPALPMREVIYIRFNESRIFLNSTRTPHAGSDHRAAPSSSIPSYFNAHSPCGE